MGAEAILTAAENAGSYPSFSCSGDIIPPTAAADATAEPEIAPNSVFARILQ